MVWLVETVLTALVLAVFSVGGVYAYDRWTNRKKKLLKEAEQRALPPPPESPELGMLRSVAETYSPEHRVNSEYRWLVKDAKWSCDREYVSIDLNGSQVEVKFKKAAWVTLPSHDQPAARALYDKVVQTVRAREMTDIAEQMPSG